MAEIFTIEEAKESAKKVAEQAKSIENAKKFELQKALDAISEKMGIGEGMEEFSALLALPEEYFSVLSPVFL
jgi:hypothetical protein